MDVKNYVYNEAKRPSLALPYNRVLLYIDTEDKNCFTGVESARPHVPTHRILARGGDQGGQAQQSTARRSALRCMYACEQFEVGGGTVVNIYHFCIRVA